MPEAVPLSRIVRVDAIPKDGDMVTIEATPAERKALAAAYKLPGIAALTATLRLTREGAGGARVQGVVHGEVTQVCVVSLDPFEAKVDEDIDVRLAPEPDARRPSHEIETVWMDDEDQPDPIVDGRIDVGALAAEFFALGLDPYPRKPGTTFESPSEPGEDDTPFAVLRKLTRDGSA
jgi:uncharacterized metal-binding protein YceD (DUF177 family)